MQGEQCWEWSSPEVAELEGRLETRPGQTARNRNYTNYHANVTACRVSYTWLSPHTPLPLPGGTGAAEHISSSRNVGQAKLQLQPWPGQAGTVPNHSFPGDPTAQPAVLRAPEQPIPELLTANSDSWFRLGDNNNLLLMVLVRKMHGVIVITSSLHPPLNFHSHTVLHPIPLPSCSHYVIR